MSVNDMNGSASEGPGAPPGKTGRFLDFRFRFYSILVQGVQGYIQKTKNVLSRNFSHTVIQKLNP